MLKQFRSWDGECPLPSWERRIFIAWCFISLRKCCGSVWREKMILVEKDLALSLILPLARFQELSGAMGALSGLARVSTALFRQLLRAWAECDPFLLFPFRTEAANSVLRRTASRERAYVLSAAKKSNGWVFPMWGWGRRQRRGCRWCLTWAVAWSKDSPEKMCSSLVNEENLATLSLQVSRISAGYCRIGEVF